MHSIQAWSPEKYKVFGDFLIEQYGGDTADKLIKEQMTEFGYSDDKAYDEVVAEACSEMLLDSDVSEKIAELTNKDKSLVQKIKQLLKNILSRIRTYMQKNKTYSPEVAELRKIEGAYEKVLALFEDALLDTAVKSRSAAVGVAEVSRDQFAKKSDKYGNEYWHIETKHDIFKGLTTAEEYRDAAYKYILGMAKGGQTVKDKNGKTIKFIRLSAKEFTRSDDSKELIDNDPENYKRKMQMIPSLEDILLSASVQWHSPDHKNHKLFKKRGFDNYRGKVRVDNVIFNTVVRIGKAPNDDVFYEIKIGVDSYVPDTNKGASRIQTPITDNSIRKKKPNVNTSAENNSAEDEISYSKKRKSDRDLLADAFDRETYRFMHGVLNSYMTTLVHFNEKNAEIFAKRMDIAEMESKRREKYIRGNFFR